MDSIQLLTDAYGRIRQLVERVADDLDHDTLIARPDDDANPIGWLIWHLTRVQDHHISEIAGREQDWTTGWSDRFDMPPDANNTGFGHTSEEVGSFDPVSSELLVIYQGAVSDHTLKYLGSLDASDLDRIVDRAWDPPVTAGVRLMSVIGDSYQHLGQAAYVRGLLERRG